MTVITAKEPKRIYVASSWRNDFQNAIVILLRSAGFEVYDFKKPAQDTGFRWSSIDPNWSRWSAKQYKAALQHDLAERGFNSDFDAMKWADACVLVLSAGSSAHLEAGYFTGAGKELHILLREADIHGHAGGSRPCARCGDMDGCFYSDAELKDPPMAAEAELMYKMATSINANPMELLGSLGVKD